MSSSHAPAEDVGAPAFDGPDETETEGEVESLLGRLRAGNPLALGEAYDLHHASLRAFAQRLLGDDVAAEDLVQETFIALPGASGRYDGSCSLKTFLLSIAANRARHHVRAASRRRAAMARFQRETDPQRSRTPEDQLAGGQLAETLLRLMDQLPVEQRLAFVLCEIEDRTSAQAARIVGTSQATVRTRLFHAKRKLRQALARGGTR